MPSPLQGVEVGSTESLPTPFRFAVARFSAFHSMPEPPTTLLPTALLYCRMARAAGGERLRRAHINVLEGRVSTIPSPPSYNRTWLRPLRRLPPNAGARGFRSRPGTSRD